MWEEVKIRVYFGKFLITVTFLESADGTQSIQIISIHKAVNRAHIQGIKN